MNISPKELAGRPEAKRVVIFLEKFEVKDEAPLPLKTLYRPVEGTVYKALKDSNTNIYFVDVPETFERDRGGWGFEGTESPEESVIQFKLIEIDGETLDTIKLTDDDKQKIVSWLEEDPMKFSWELSPKTPVGGAQKELTVKDLVEGWGKDDSLGDSIEHLLDESLSTIFETHPRLFNALTSLVVTIAMQENGQIPRMAEQDTFLMNTKNRTTIPSMITALLNAHSVTPSVPTIIEVLRLALLEMSKVMEGGPMDNMINKLKEDI